MLRWAELRAKPQPIEDTKRPRIEGEARTEGEARD